MVWQDVGTLHHLWLRMQTTFHSTIVEHGEVLIENKLVHFLRPIRFLRTMRSPRMDGRMMLENSELIP